MGLRLRLFLFSVVLIALSVAAADLYLGDGLDRLLTARIREDLRIRLELVAHHAAAFPPDAVAGWDRVADELEKLAQTRVTLLSSDGRVLGDSDLDLAGVQAAENHRDRPEVRQALSQGEGEAVRLSHTLGQRMLYLAQPLPGASGLIARVAVPLAELDEVRGELHGLLGLATVVALAVAAVLSALATHLGSGRIRTVTAVARRLASGDLAARTRLAGRDEISELGRTLDQLAEGLDNSLGRLREERDLLAGILQGMDEGVLLLDREGMIGIINPALRDMLCLGGEATGRPLLDVIRAAELKMLIDRVREGGESQHAELDLPGLRPRRARVRVSPLRQDPARLVLVFLDVTEVRRLESVRRDFVANVSHELRTPVAAVRSAAETLAEALDRDPVAAREFVAMIDRNAERLQRLVEDLLDLSRIEAPEYRMRSETLELKHALAAVLEPFAARAAENGLALSVELPADLRVTADRRGLEQVVGNLLDNGVKYCPRGAALSVTAVEHQGRVRIAVTDTGPGIEALHLPRLFERFYRVDKGRSREQGGTGLGLSIVKRLVEAMGGEVGVESMPGRGSTFWFTLPRA